MYVGCTILPVSPQQGIHDCLVSCSSFGLLLGYADYISWLFVRGGSLLISLDVCVVDQQGASEGFLTNELEAFFVLGTCMIKEEIGYS